jgi:tetratricopeptide (TPR) repeat protein
MWQEIGRVRPGNVQAHVSLAGAYENLGRRKDAEVEYDQILRLDPGNEVAREALTRLRRGVVRERRSLSSASRAPETKSGESLPSEPESDSN